MTHPPTATPDVNTDRTASPAQFGEDIPVDWIYLRDTIRVNDALLQEIRAEVTVRRLAPTATLALVAREIVHDPGFVLTGLLGHPLVLVAETYRGNNGAVDASAPVGGTGFRGDAGAAGQGQSGQSGGAGRHGGDGDPGSAASTVTVLAHRISDLTIAARGGRGGRGGAGGSGGHGYDAARGPNKPGEDRPEPGQGGPGGPGGNGAVGGPAALIIVDTTAWTNLTLDGAGGLPGDAGAAGQGGRGGMVGGVGPVGDPGPDGTPGVAGPGPGPAVQPVLAVHGNDDWWALVRLRLGGHAKEWAAYRTRVGEFLFRSYAPGLADRKGLRETASLEFLRALDLDAGQDRAGELSRWIATNLSPIGQPYNLDLMPDFPHFEQVVTDYDNIVKSLFDNALSLLLASVDTGQKNDRLTADVNRVNDMRPVLNLEDRAAQLALEEAKGRAKVIDQQMEEVKAQLSAVQDEMTLERMEFPPGNDLGPLIGAAIAVAAAVSAVYTGGASIVAFLAAAQLMAKTGDALGAFNATTGESKDGGKLIEWWDWSDAGNPRLKEEDKGKAGGFKELVETGGKLIDAGRAVAELFQTKIDGKLQNRQRDLVARQLDLTRQRGLQILDVNQKGALQVATTAKIAANQRDLDRLRNLQADWASDIAALGMISRTLIDQTQAYVDVLIRYAFYAYRALDLFTVSSDRSAGFSFDLGHLHPDEVENAYLALSRGEDSRVIPLLQSYLSSWGRMPELLGLRSFYDQYQSELQHAVSFITLTSPDVLDGLRSSGTATFAVPLTEFPEAWSELKTEEVYVALLGARADEPAVNVFVQHGGQATNRLRNGTLRDTGGQPVSTTAEAVFDKRTPGSTPANRPAFWGRSPVTTWRVSIEPLSAQQTGLDLTGLTELHLTLRYAFYAVPSVAAPAVPSMPVHADYDGDNLPDAATWDSVTGAWTVQPSSGAPARTVPFGQAGDIPVPSDYDGDGQADLAVFRPAGRTLYSRPYAGGPTAVHLWRTPDYDPVPEDYPGMDRLANAFDVRAADLTNAGRHEEAVDVQLQARDAYAQLADKAPVYRSALAQTLVMLGVYCTRAGHHDDAVAASREATNLYRTIGDKPQWAWALGNLSAVLTAAGRQDEAVATQNQSVSVYRELASADPAYRSALAQTLVMLGVYCTRAGRHDDAVAASREGANLYQAIGDKPQWAWALGNLAAAFSAAGRPSDAADSQRQACDLYRELAAADSAYRPLLAQTAFQLAQYLVSAGRRPEALTAAQEAAAVYTQLNAAESGKYAAQLDAAVRLRDSLAGS
ncbi:tetratricopeptide repeat protein [Kitasatospora sp. McL0602]|uniref:tetratricopeptide repeat protein n=1 Tax=Kitasatospora sp. McL0602 TaxID=3439530 RepID=UPI003F8928C9